MIELLDPDDPDAPFPRLEDAESSPNGLLAVGGDLTPGRLLNAYSHGIFPWYNDGQPILWWSPNPRMVLFPKDFHLSRSLKKSLRKNQFEFSFDRNFKDVIRACAQTREDQVGTWITSEMQNAYNKMHQLGYAHSVEVWQKQNLVGGLYGMSIGKVFFGESMFSHVSDASKAAMYFLCRQLQEWEFKLIDCQIYTSHLESLGAVEITRKDFAGFLEQYCSLQNENGSWTL